MPRFTYSPSRSSAATRAASCSRVRRWVRSGVLTRRLGPGGGWSASRCSCERPARGSRPRPDGRRSRPGGCCQDGVARQGRPARLRLSDQGGEPGRSEEGTDAAATGPQSLGEGALRGELHLQLSGQELAGKLPILAHGMPDSPKPPTARLAPWPISATASAAVAIVLFTI
jgi:hypothetical protein